MSEPTVVSLCSGCGGLDVGLENVGYRTVAVAEVDADACRVLDRRFPGVPNLGDLRTIDWSGVERPDVAAAGFPCQPVSLAGRGLVEADPRWLWPEVARCLRVVRPRFVLLENVPGIFRRPPSGGPRPVVAVHDGLAALGYDAVWTGLRAADVGAPHGRDRWFCVGVLASESELPGVDADGGVRRGGAGAHGRPAQAALPPGEEVARAADALADRAGAPPDADGGRLDGSGGRDARRAAAGGEDRRSEPARPSEASADAGHRRVDLGPRPAGREGRERPPERREPRPDGRGAAPDADRPGREGTEPERAAGRRGPSDGDKAPADAGRDRRVRRPALDGADGGVDVERGDDAHGRDLGGSGTRDGHAREAVADAGRRRRRGRQNVEGKGPAGRGGPSRDGRATPPDTASGDEPQQSEGDGREQAVVRAEPGAGGRDSGGETAEGVQDVGGSAGVEWGAYEPAIRRWELATGRAAPRPTDDRGRLDPRFPEWMLGFPYGWVEVEGVSRTAQLRLIGNAVQVQCAEVIGLWLAEIGGFA